MTTRPIELSLQAINTRLERSATAAQQRTVAPQPTRFDGVTGGFSGAVPRFRPLGSDGGVLGLPQASGALGVGAPVGFVAGLGSATPRLGDPGLGGAVLSPEAIRASVLAQTGWQVGDGTPTTEGIVARYPFDVYYSALTGTVYVWQPSTTSTPGAWVGVSQQAVGYGAPGSLDIEVVGGTYLNATNDDLYVGGESGWTLVTGGGGGGSAASAALGIVTTSSLAENTPTVLSFDSDSSYKAWDNGSFWSSGNPTRITFANAGFYEITVHSPCDMYSASNSQTEWDCKVRVYNSSGVQQVTFDAVKSWFMLTAGGINDLQYFDFSMPIEAVAGGYYITLEVQQRNSGTATLRFAASDYAWVTVKTLG